MIDVKLKFEEAKTFTGIKELPMQNSVIYLFMLQKNKNGKSFLKLRR